MARIRLLSEETINQIAAGEVIENPASVVKELAENAIDAGASEIRIEIRGGGQQLIRVSDNGCGMGADDAALSLERHATSKICRADDLSELRTMGFRGEALASIGAISKLTLTTALEKGPGHQIEMEGGRLLKVAPCPRQRGTTIDIRSLFYNVPARKKFQKSAPVNAAEITKTVTLLSLAYPEIGFTLVHQERETFCAPALEAGSFYSRALQVLGETFCAASFQIDHKGFRGFAGNPSQHRPNRSGQYLFINRRPIFSLALSHAVRDGYGTRLTEHRHPIYLLHLDIPPHLIDVNVHPQKREVRFQEERLIKEELREVIQQAFEEPKGAPPVLIRSLLPPPSQPFPWDLPLSFKMREERADPEPLCAPIHEEVHPLGVFSHYLLLEEGNLLTLIDLLAAREQVAFEKLSKKGAIEKTGLLLPFVFELSSAEAHAMEAHLSLFEELGFSLRLSGAQSFIVDAIPAFLETSAIRDALMQIIEGKTSLMNSAQLLSRFARGNKKQFMLQEALALFKELRKCSSPFQNFQGKPIILHLNQDEIAKLFSKKI
jgi:DNA mismatch repair protein MutL